MKTFIIFLALLSFSALSYSCPTPVQLSLTNQLSQTIEVLSTCNTGSWEVEFTLYDEPISFVIQLIPKVIGIPSAVSTLTIEGKNNASDPYETLIVVNGKTGSLSVSSLAAGVTFDNDIAGDNSHGKVIRFRTQYLRFLYQKTAPSPGYFILFRISTQVPGFDLDGDGYTFPGEDCCDTHRACRKPSFVNKGAVNIPGNGINDGSIGDCASDPIEETQCQATTCTDGCTAEQLVRAMNLCKFTNETSKEWGVLSAKIALADGNGSPCSTQSAVMSTFGNPSDYYHNPGETFASLSSGRGDGLSDLNCGTQSQVPAAYRNQHGGVLYDPNSCSTSTNINAYDAFNLIIKIKVPTNANSFSFLIRFISQEYPQWVCSQFNDHFLGLIFRGADPNNLTPFDHNMATFDRNGQKLAFSIFAHELFTVCNPTTVNSVNFGPNCNSSLLNQMAGTAFPDRAGSGTLRIETGVYPGEIIDLHLIVFDVGDGVLLSNVFLDDFKWSSNAAGQAGLGFEEFCPEDQGFPQTLVGQTVTLANCDPNNFGESSRYCAPGGVWEPIQDFCDVCPGGTESPSGTLSIDGCTDTDECETNNGNCPAEAKCVNSIGSFSCECPPDFIFSEGSCLAINLCSSNPCHPFANCVNSPGAFACTCLPGYDGDGITSCLPDLNTVRISQCIPTARYLFEGNTLDSSGNDRSIDIGNAQYESFYMRNEPNNKALRVTGVQIITEPLPLDSMTAITILFNMETMTQSFDLIQLKENVGDTEFESILTVSVLTSGKFQWKSYGQIIGTSYRYLLPGRSYYFVISLRNGQMVNFVEEVQIGTFNLNLPASFTARFSAGRNMNGYIDDVTICSTPIYNTNYLTYSAGIRCDQTVCNPCYNSKTTAVCGQKLLRLSNQP